MKPISKKVARRVIREWRAGTFWWSQQRDYYDQRPSTQRSCLGGALTELSERAAKMLGRVVKTRLGGKCPYTLVPGQTVEQFLAESLKDYRWCRSACAGLRWLLARVPEADPPEPGRLFAEPDTRRQRTKMRGGGD